MLLAIRERIMGIVGWVVLGLLAIAFGFFGLNSYLTDDSLLYAASVNDVEITPQQHQRAYQGLKNRMEVMLGDNYNPALFDEEYLKRTSLESLIVEQLLIAESDNQKFSVSDQLIARTLNDEDAFKEDGLFSREKYKRTLRLQGATAQKFEDRIAREYQINQFRTGIVSTSTSFRGALDRTFRLAGQLRNFDYVVIPTANYEAEVSISQSEIAEYYEANKQQYLTGEQLSLKYIELVSSDILSGAQLSDDELLVLYEERLDLYTTPEERKARHILIGLSQNTSDDDVAEAREKAERLLAELVEGASFEELAREHSDDSVSAGKGGDLGYFGKGVMVPEFEDVAFQIAEGEISEIVRSAFGYHIIRVDNIRGGEVTPFDEVKEELSASVIDEERDDIFFERSDLLANLVYENIDSLKPAAAELGLEIRNTGWIKRSGGEGIGKYRKIVNAAFSDELLQEGRNSEVIEVKDGRIFVVRVDEYQAAEVQVLEEVKDRVKASIKRQALATIIADTGQTMLKELETGVDLHELAEKGGFSVTNTGPVTRGNPGTSSELLRVAFQLAYPEKEHPVPTVFALASGDYAVLSLLEVKAGDPDSISDEARKKLLYELSKNQGLNEMAAVIDYLRSRAVIDVPTR